MCLQMLKGNVDIYYMLMLLWLHICNSCGHSQMLGEAYLSELKFLDKVSSAIDIVFQNPDNKGKTKPTIYDNTHQNGRKTQQNTL